MSTFQIWFLPLFKEGLTVIWKIIYHKQKNQRNRKLLPTTSLSFRNRNILVIHYNLEKKFIIVYFFLYNAVLQKNIERTCKLAFNKRL